MKLNICKITTNICIIYWIIKHMFLINSLQIHFYACFVNALALKCFSDKLLHLRTRVMFRLYSVTDLLFQWPGWIFYFLSFFCEAEKRKPDNLCAKLAVGSLFSQYHQLYFKCSYINLWISWRIIIIIWLMNRWKSSSRQIILHI